MNTDTPIPRTDEWETYCDESYYRLWRVRRKNERGFNDGYHVHNGDEARALVDLLNKQDSELISARAEIERLDTAGIHSCHDNCQRPNCVLRRELKAVTEQLKNAQAELLKSCLREQLYHEDYKAEKNRADDALLELNAVTDQRDRLAEALREITTYDPSDGQCNSRYSCKYIAEQALQSLTTKSPSSAAGRLRHVRWNEVLGISATKEHDEN